MKHISARQIYFLLACIFPVAKLILLPAQLANTSGNDLLFPALLHILLQAGAVFCVLLLAQKRQTFYELLEGAFGKIAAKVLTCVFALFLFFAALLPILEQKLFVQSVCYDTLPSYVSFSPFFLFAAYLCSKPLASYGRTWDILGPVALMGLLGIFILSAPNADFAAILPAGAAGASGFLKSAEAGFAWFFDAALLIPLLGKIEYRKGMAWKGMLFYLLGGALVLFFLAVFYGIFQETAVNHLFAFASAPRYFSAVTVLGRIDYLFIYALAMVMAFLCALPLQGGIECLLQSFGRKKYLPTVLAVALGALFFALMFLFDYRFGDVLDVFTKTVFWIFPVFTLAVPALMLLFLAKGGRRETA